MRNREASLQAEIVAWIRAAAPQCITFAVLNDGLYSKPEASKRRWMGLLAGVPDLVVIAPGGKAHHLEVKAPGGALSPEQRSVIGKLCTLEAPVAVVKNLDEAQAALKQWGIDLQV